MTSRSLWRDLKQSIRRPEFWAYSSWLGIVTKYRRSRLGLLWLVMPAVLYILGVGYFFSRLQGHSPSEFMAHMGVGYLLFRLLSMVINEASSVLPQHQSFILDGHQRLTDFFLRVIAKALFYFLMGLPVVALVLLQAPQMDATGLLSLFASIPLFILNVAWVSVVIALLGARFPDIHELMGTIFIFGFILTPILWYASRAPIGTPHGIFMRLNPLYHLIEIVRAPLLGEPIESFTLWYLSLFTLGGWLLASLAYRRYARFVPIWV